MITAVEIYESGALRRSDSIRLLILGTTRPGNNHDAWVDPGATRMRVVFVVIISKSSPRYQPDLHPSREEWVFCFGASQVGSAFLSTPPGAHTTLAPASGKLYTEKSFSQAIL